ncbi:hypothetical protein ORIO_00570 [Cereibacter azotoformans]|uniref:Uncharacterized protein n=1 Tax=Cereibacter sphaeroides (strain ATCC 17025 / ATH 2.4.3) TaxID=349102 RepID=A4WNQ6_CERS5|nr:hypothetical protein [Cereibacter azotoformans]ULB08435.1 hypothetical protein ORIO_00570 [Cereibacter azotoformans]
MGSQIQRRSSDAIAEKSREKRASLPVIHLPNAGLAASAVRFSEIEAVAETFCSGSNGYSIKVPSRPDAKLDLLRRLPAQEKCERFAHQLEVALRTQASDGDVIAAVEAIVGSYRTGDRAPRSYVDGMIADLIDLAEDRRWPVAAINGGMSTICRSSPFLPALSEVIDAITDAHQRLRFAEWAAQEAAVLSADLYWDCVDAGLIEDTGDF